MYPTQCFSNQTPYCNPCTMPQVNAVKIDINNPQAYGGMNSQGQINPTSPTQNAQSAYNYPYAPVYAMPQVAQYNTPASYPIPPMMPQQNVIQQTAIQQNAPQQVVAPIANNIAAVPAQNTVPTTNNIAAVPAQNVPATNPQVQYIPVPVPVPAAPPVPQPVPVAPSVSQNVNVNPSIPAAVVDKTQNTTVAPVAPVNTQLPGGVDVNSVISALSSTDPDAQTAAIQKIAEVAQTDPVAARALLNEQTFGQLVKVINADTSKLQGPSGKPDPKNLSPLEKAEINKQFAVYTLAILQKNFRDEINKEMKKNNLPDIAINDLPYIKEGIVNNLKDNPNPTIREACLSALNYVGRPEDKEVLRVLYDISAKHDSNPAVRTSAKDYLSKLPA